MAAWCFSISGRLGAYRAARKCQRLIGCRQNWEGRALRFYHSRSIIVAAMSSLLWRAWAEVTQHLRREIDKRHVPVNAIGMPTTLLIDAQGRELGRVIGPAEWDGPAMLSRLTSYLEAHDRGGSADPHTD
jgi:hypothetical protein